MSPPFSTKRIVLFASFSVPGTGICAKTSAREWQAVQRSASAKTRSRIAQPSAGREKSRGRGVARSIAPPESVGGDDHRIEARPKVQDLEQPVQAVVPIREDAHAHSAYMERVERLDHVIEDAPGIPARKGVEECVEHCITIVCECYVIEHRVDETSPPRARLRIVASQT